MKLIHETPEGCMCYQGINWSKSYNTKFRLILVIWRFIFYFRWRSEHVGGKRIILDAHYNKYGGFLHRVYIELDTLTLNLRGKRLSFEYLEDLVRGKE